MSERRDTPRASRYAISLPVLIRATEEHRKLIRATEEKAIVDFAGFAYSLPGSPAVVNITNTKVQAITKTIGSRAWERLTGILQLRDGYQAGDTYLVRKATEKLRGPKEAGNIGQPAFDQAMEMWLAQQFSERMRRARLVLWQNLKRGRQELAVFCGDLVTAAWVRGILRDLRACPSCDNPFRPERPDQVYCSIVCRERFRKRRNRSKAKKGE